MIRLVLFDVDGTLIRSGGAGVKAFAKTLASAFNVREGTERVRFGGRTDTSLVRELFEHAGIEPTPEHFRRFFDYYVFWLDHLLHHSSVGGACPGVWWFLQQLKKQPRRPALGLLTGNIRLGAEIKLRRYGLWEEFEMGAFGDDHEDRNQIAHIARDRGSRLFDQPLNGSEILVVGDTPRDVDCGRAIGAKVLAVTTGGATAAELEPHRPDWLVSDLREVGAAQVCGSASGGT